VAIVAVFIVAALFWAVWKGKLGKQQLPPILLGLAGAFLAARGNFIIGAAALALGIIWYRGLTSRLLGAKAPQSDQYAIDKARFMLGVSRFDNAEYIRQRHQALVAKNDTETGGGTERAKELNAARDLLLRDLKDKRRFGDR
jgi:hypothetical protein